MVYHTNYFFGAIDAQELFKKVNQTSVQQKDLYYFWFFRCKPLKVLVQA